MIGLQRLCNRAGAQYTARAHILVIGQELLVVGHVSQRPQCWLRAWFYATSSTHMYIQFNQSIFV